MRKIFIGLLCIISFSGYAQKRVSLYEKKIPNSKPVENKEQEQANAVVDSLTSAISVPSLTLFLAPKALANGTAVIICPGGGYQTLLSKREGSDVARAFNKLGISAFVLRYRLPDDEVLMDKTIGPMQDAQQAIKLIRENAEIWEIDPNKIGIMGFSAGGHLASTVGVHYDVPKIQNNKGTSLRPNFMLLINPVISFTDSIGHMGSRENLLGKNPTQEILTFFSNELHVTPATPPTFLVHAGPDVVVPVENSIAFYQALKLNKVAAGLHVYAKGEHGFLTSPDVEEWFGRCIYWMESMSLLKNK